MNAITSLHAAADRLRGHNDALSGLPPAPDASPAYMAGYTRGATAAAGRRDVPNVRPMAIRAPGRVRA